MRYGVRVDPGGDEREGHDEVRPVTYGLAGVQVDRSGPRGFGMAAARPEPTFTPPPDSVSDAALTRRSDADHAEMMRGLRVVYAYNRHIQTIRLAIKEMYERASPVPNIVRSKAQRSR